MVLTHDRSIWPRRWFPDISKRRSGSDRGQGGKPMSDILTVKDLCLWYGSAPGAEGREHRHSRKEHHGADRPVGLRQVHLSQDAEPHERSGAGREDHGHGRYWMARTSSTTSLDVNLLRKQVGMVFQKPNPFPMSIYDNIAYGPRTHGMHAQGEAGRDRGANRLRDAAIWDEVKDRLQEERAAAFRRPAAAAVHRPGAGGQAGGAADGRTHQRAGPHLHVQD